MRTVTRHGVRLEIDLHDQIGWHAYFDLTVNDMERLRSVCRTGQWVVDVGANIGETSMLAAQGVGSTGKVFALEPHPGNYRRMISNLALNSFTNITPIQVALGDAEGSAMMDEPRHDNAGAHRVATTGSIPVRVTTLDALALDRVDVLKVDTEGYETRVVRGGRSTIARSRPVMFIEVHDGHLRDAGSSARELIRYVRELGYEVHDADTDQAVFPDSDFSNWTNVICLPSAGPASTLS